MKRGSIIILPDNQGLIRCRIELSDDGTVWLSANEIADLYDVSVELVESHIKRVFQEGELYRTDVTMEYKHTLDSGVTVSVEYYNLEVIIALSFRLKHYICRIFRKWISDKIKHRVTQETTPIVINILHKYRPIN